MRLSELNPQWVGAGGEGISDSEGKPAPKWHGFITNGEVRNGLIV